MDAGVVALVLLSALLHAGWNIVLKVKGDRLLVMTLIANGASVLALCLLPFVPVPPVAAWPYLAISLVLQCGYHVFLIQAYRYGDLGQVYPIARGAAPVFVLLPAVFIAGDRLTPLSAIAVLVIAAGIASLAFHKGAVHTGHRGVPYALGTAAFIAAYTVVDGLGARETGSPHAYTLWLFAINGLPLLAMSLFWHGSRTFGFVRDNWRIGLACGAMSLAAYWLVVWALSMAPMAQVAALRETSVVFAALFATVFLKEKLGPWRIAAACVVAGGIVMLRWA
jgi:drug/metabolite transporter (DMT)-like permease